MSDDFQNIVTGTLTYKDIDFTFVFDRTELRLIPPKEKARDVSYWTKRPLGNGIYTFGDPVLMEESFLVGKCNEGLEIVLFPVQGQSISFFNNVLIIDVYAYIWKRLRGCPVARISFQSLELDYIYPTRKAIANSSSAESGGLIIETKPYKDRLSEKRTFIVDGKEVSVHFGIALVPGGNRSVHSLTMHSEMYFEFDETEDYAFVFRLYLIAKNLVQFLCYRKNVPFSAINLSTPEKENYLLFAKLFVLNQNETTEERCLKDGRFIGYDYIDNCIGDILSDISKGVLYTRNIPPTYRSGTTIDAARFVMITAAFEWEFRRLYPDGIAKRKRTIDAENKAEDALKRLFETSTGKLRDLYKNLINNIRFTQLSSRVNHTGKTLGDIINPFGQRLYRINNQELKYEEMGMRLGKQRNNYAHGNLDQDFVGLSLLDVIYLEMVVYAMQLKYYRVDDLSIQRAINDLFHQSILFQDK